MLSSNSQPPVVVVRVGCASVSAFIREHARRVTQGGLFLETAELYPVGSRIAFSLVLGSGQRLLGGTGVVRWSQGPASPFDRPRLAGMGLRFEELDAESRQLVALLVATQPENAKEPEPPGPRIAELLTGGGSAALELAAPEAAVAPPAFGSARGLPPELEALPPLPSAPRVTPLMDAPRIAPIVELPPGPSATRSSGPPGLAARTGSGSSKTPAPRTPAPARRATKTPPPAAPAAGRWEAPQGRPSPAPRRAVTSPGAPLSAVLPLPAPSSRDVLPELPLEALALLAPSPREAPLLPTPEDLLAQLPESPARSPLAPTPAAAAEHAAAMPLPAPTREPPPAPADLPPLPPPAPTSAPVRAAQLPSPPAAAPAPQAPALAEVHPPRPSAAAVPAAPRAPATAAPLEAPVPERKQGAQRVTRAIEALRRQEYAKAEAELQLAVAHEPDNARFRFELGLVYFEWSDGKTQNHDGSAEACFARAADLDSSFDQPLVYLGQVQLRRRLYRDAETAFREALRRQPHGRGAQEGLRVIAAMRWKQRMLRGLVAAAVLVLPVGGYLLKRSPVRAVPEATAAATPAPVAAAPAAASSTPALAPAVAAPLAAAPGPEATAAAPSPAAVAAAPPQPAALAAAEPAAAPLSEKPAPPKRATRRLRPPSVSRVESAASAQPTAPARGAGGSPASLVKEGDDALRSGRADEALAAFSRALEANPGFAAAHRGLGSVHMMQGNDAKAAASFRAYLKLAPNAPDAGRIQALLSGLE